MTTTSIGALYVGRLIIGLGNGILLTFSQLYIQVRSWSPLKQRARSLILMMCRSEGMRSGLLPWNYDLHLHVLDFHRLAHWHDHR